MKEVPVGPHRVALVSDQDFRRLSQYRWSVSRYGYARHSIFVGDDETVDILMHRIVIPCPTGFTVDHINFNKLDNRRENLRVLSGAENNHHYPAVGISFVKAMRKFQANIHHAGRCCHLGTYTSPTAALLVRVHAEIALRGRLSQFNRDGNTDGPFSRCLKEMVA